ncbi:DNA mismatch repair protein MutS [Dubosiella muris]|uniref:DNA mismatch repair protein MutS n=1 Tax=Dubosiella muris TaxID=3038133 RepID=A0AC61R776_9FIRM|nr:DNA mismatch repair protein MutS [Dubosiella muris]TGY65939.1 DNA mismatch repair protein MutS [Dubosiella muris]
MPKKQQYTPMMQHYLKLKEENQDSILFYRLGDFYEMFFEDAKTASRELDLVLTGRSAGVEEKVPMCGIPFHAAQAYIQRLIKKGYKVAICEQLSDPSQSKGLVDRDIIKIVTPGTYMEETSESKASNYLAAIHMNGYEVCVLYCELSTGELRSQKLERSLVRLQKALLEMNVSEIVVDSTMDKRWKAAFEELDRFLISTHKKSPLEPDDEKLLTENDESMRETLGLLMGYLKKTQKQHIDHFFQIEKMDQDHILQMDYDTKQHLELTESRSNAAKAISLWEFMDRTQSAMGARLLKQWIVAPLIEQGPIEQRQDAIEQLMDDFMLREQLKDHLGFIYDMERLASRIAYGNASPRDIIQLVASLEHAAPILEMAGRLEAYPQFQSVPTCQSLYETIQGAIVDEPPLTLKEGGVFRAGYSEELDEVKKIADEGQNYIIALEQKERERTEVRSLKIGYNRVFGYYIEVRNGNLERIKPEFGYVAKQTLANATRFITQELKEEEEKILHAQERKVKLEMELFQQLLATIKANLFDLHTCAHALATVDVLVALAELAGKEGYVRPRFNASHRVEVLEGKHPILDARMSAYISNDWIMDEQEHIELITGPNMGGKSTYMRQNALLVIMAQMGSFIPARSANLPLFDRIFTRIGASDDLLTGKSTFMMEMMEANAALQYATADSLIIFDEIGRGTATYDGMAIAQAMLEYIDAALQAKTLFSTHYHELTNLEEEHATMKNVHVDVQEKKGEIEFRYRIVKGKADKSYGINVARLAKLPKVVLERASSLLKGFESQDNTSGYQPNLFIMDEVKPEKSKLIQKLQTIDVDELTPREALACLYELKKLQEEIEE